MKKAEILPNNHFSLQITNDMVQICQPFFQQSKVNICIYGRFFDDGNCYMLTSSRDWHLHHFSKEYMVTAPVPQNLLDEKFYYFISKNGPYANVLHDARLFGYDHIIDLIQVYDGYYDMFSFASKPENEEVVNFYFNNRDILENFTCYFRNKAEKLIKESNEHKIMLLEHMRSTFKSSDLITSNTQVYGFQEKFKNKIYLDLKNKMIRITQRELECLTHLAMGCTAKQTAKILAISPKTVESYICNSRKKLGLYRKSDVIGILLRNFSL